MSDRPKFALRFISGKYQGGEFPLRPNREIVIGRSSDLDMVLVEDMVSRRHAKITTSETEHFIEDAGSTNGTFVNGEKIVGRVKLHEGDRILVGTSIIKVVAAEGAVATPAEEGEAKKRLEAGGARPTTMGRPMSGAIEEIPLPDLIQLLTTSRKSGALIINNGYSVGKIFFRKGSLYFASINDDFAVTPQKAMFRMLTWTSGMFELDPTAEIKPEKEMTESPEALLMEGMRQLDEFQEMQARLPPLGSPLAVPTPLAGKLRDLTPSELDVFQLVLDHGSVQKVLDSFPGSDLDAAQSLQTLLKKEFIIVP